jgi:hypothetical protein
MRCAILFSLLGTAKAIFQPNNRAELKTAVDACINDVADGSCTTFSAGAVPSGQGSGTYGAIGTWDTSLVTNMELLFEQKQEFSQDINDWDVSSVTSFYYMFKSASKMTSPLNKWDVSSGVIFQRMFFGAYSLASAFPDIRQWDVSKGEDFRQMFAHSKNFDWDFSCWDVSSVKFDLSIENINYHQNTNGLSDMFAGKTSTPAITLCWPIADANHPSAGGSGNGVFYSSTYKISDGDASCSASEVCTWCSENQYVQSNACAACPLGTENPAGDDAGGSDTTCQAISCSINEFVESNVCKSCATGSERPAGDLATGDDTECIRTICLANFHVKDSACVACAAGKVNDAGDDASTGNTDCDEVICGENKRVKDNACSECASGLVRLAGDKASGADTECYAADSCGGVECSSVGSSSCESHTCVCNPNFSGVRCEKDRSVAGKLKELESLRLKALPTRQQLHDRKKKIKELAKADLEHELSQGKSVAEAVKSASYTVNVEDLQHEVKAVVSQLGKIPVMAVGPANKDEQDTCDQGPSCATLNVAEDGSEITLLDADDEVGSWTVLRNGDDIISKQIRVSEFEFDMHCWSGSDWGVATRLDTTDAAKLFVCNGNTLLISSQSALCSPGTCKNGGVCSSDGASFSCSCPTGFTGDICENTGTLTHCHQIDCSDFGGFKAGADECGSVGDECVVGKCCEYPTKSAFDTHCDTLTSKEDYVNAKCCHRNICV